MLVYSCSVGVVMSYNDRDLLLVQRLKDKSLT